MVEGVSKVIDSMQLDTRIMRTATQTFEREFEYIEQQITDAKGSMGGADTGADWERETAPW